MRIGRITPILRIFDDAKAREFYVGYLGFEVDWEHRFEPTCRCIFKCRAEIA
jgi:catechol 2,3-dioxygenase-like lactoylglutathione lyase family enzyme